MAKIIDITDKLSLEKTKIKIKDEEYEVDDSAVTVLKILPKFDGKVENKAINEVFEMLFSEKDKEKIKALNLNFKDFSTLVLEAISVITGEINNEGETQTPATT